MKTLSRRVFLGNLGLLASGLWAGSSTVVHGETKGRRRRGKAELVRTLSGVHNFLTTPFRSNYELDADGLRRNVADHARSAPKNMTIVVSGGLGELFTLGVQEHKQLVAAAVAGAQGKLPVVAGVGGAYRNALAMAKNAQAAGADAIFIFGYPFACNNTEGDYQYLYDVAKSVQIGAMAYPCGKNEFRANSMKRLAKLPNFMGIKDSSGDVKVGKALGSLVGDEFLWVAEGEGHAEKTLPAGGQAYTTAVATFVPQACHEFWQHGVAGNSERMKKVYKTRIAPVVKLRGVKPGYGISGIKVALEALGRAGGPVRPPGTQVEPEDRPKIAAIARKHAEKLR